MKNGRNIIRAIASSVLAAAVLACGPAPPAEPPPAGLIPAELPGICARTPEVQVAIIRELALDGPRMGCADIVPGEMHRLRRLSVVTPHLMPGDLHGMPNVVRMELTLGQSWPQPGSLEGPRGLRELGIRLTGPRRDWRVEPGTFRPMSMLRKLEINGRTNVRVHLTNRSLRGLKELRELQVDSLESAEPEALRMMPKLERLRLRAAFRLPAERDTAPELPPTVIRDAEKLESHELRNFREER